MLPESVLRNNSASDKIWCYCSFPVAKICTLLHWCNGVQRMCSVQLEITVGCGYRCKGCQDFDKKWAVTANMAPSDTQTPILYAEYVTQTFFFCLSVVKKENCREALGRSMALTQYRPPPQWIDHSEGEFDGTDAATTVQSILLLLKYNMMEPQSIRIPPPLPKEKRRKQRQRAEAGIQVQETTNN